MVSILLNIKISIGPLQYAKPDTSLDCNRIPAFTEKVTTASCLKEPALFVSPPHHKQDIPGWAGEPGVACLERSDTSRAICPFSRAVLTSELLHRIGSNLGCAPENDSKSASPVKESQGIQSKIKHPGTKRAALVSHANESRALRPVLVKLLVVFDQHLHA